MGTSSKGSHSRAHIPNKHVEHPKGRTGGAFGKQDKFHPAKPSGRKGRC